MTIAWWELALRMVGAVVAGGIIGFQRERADRPAGLRTHVLVCLGSTVFTLVSIYSFPGRAGVDPTRIAAQVVTGIGFLGAGTIMRQGSIVVGLTTAASLWAVAAVGLALGAGLYELSAIATLLVLITLTLMKRIEGRAAGRPHRVVSVVVKDDPGQFGRIDAALSGLGVRAVKMESERQGENRAMLNLVLELPSSIEPQTVFGVISSVEGVIDVRLD